MFTADDVKVGNGSKYQSAGIAEKVVITDVVLNENATYNTKSLSLKTMNSENQEGQSKRLSLNNVLKDGSQITAWEITAKYLISVIMSATGKSLEEARVILRAENEQKLVENLKSEILNKPFRGLFTSKEYQPGKFAIELYATEPVGGTRLYFDPTNPKHNSRLPQADATSPDSATAKKDDLPF